MELNHNKKRGGLWLRFQDTGQRCVAILTKNGHFTSFLELYAW